MNIVNTLMSLLTSSGAHQSISTALGLTEEKASKAVSATVPSLLAAFTGMASTGQGAQQLLNAASQQDSGMLDNLSGVISQKGPALADQGNTLLNSLLGGQSSMMGNVLSRFTGVGEGAMGKILGMLAPIVLGFLGKQAAGTGASGLAKLLTGQRDNIKSAMPTGLTSMLTGSIPGLGSLLNTTTNTYQQTTGPARSTPASDYVSHSDRTTTTAPRKSPLNWVLPAAVVLGLLAALPLLFKRNRDVEVVAPPTPVVQQPVVREPTVREAAGTPARTVTGTETSASFVTESTRLMNEATEALAKIRDTASAEAAVPTLQDINRRFGTLKSSWSSLPESARSSAQAALSPLASKFESATESLLSMPAVGNIIQPQVKELMGHLRTLTQPAPAPTAPIQ